jgi:hypothetical protein
MSQYNFYDSQKTRENRDINKGIEKPKIGNPVEIKTKILEQYDWYNGAIDSDEKLKALVQTKTTLSNQILENYQLLQSKEANLSEEQIGILNETLNRLDGEYKQISTQCEDYYRDKLTYLRENFPDIYDRLVNGDVPLSRETLEHVLDMFCQSETGAIDRRQAVSKGLDYMKEKHNLPQDFFDYSKIDQFI